MHRVAGNIKLGHNLTQSWYIRIHDRRPNECLGKERIGVWYRYLKRGIQWNVGYFVLESESSLRRL